jgi:hypothetical protein
MAGTTGVSISIYLYIAQTSSIFDLRPERLAEIVAGRGFCNLRYPAGALGGRKSAVGIEITCWTGSRRSYHLRRTEPSEVPQPLLAPMWSATSGLPGYRLQYLDPSIL